MAREQNIFYKLVRDENSATELLCNLMRFAAFRRPLLSLLFSEQCAGKIEYGAIDTQYHLDGSGRPDLVIDSDEVFAFVEVKVEKGCGLTGHQPTGYLDALRNDKRPERWLVFLVPTGWVHEPELLNRLKAAPKDGSIKTPLPVYWENVLDIIVKNNLQDLSPVFGEFHRLLESWYRAIPIIFEPKEVRMLFTKEFPENVIALAKLGKLIDRVREKCSTYAPRQSFPRILCPEDEYGFYITNDQGQEIFWFGMWIPFWKQERSPLCFGVWDAWPKAVRVAFSDSCKNTKRCQEESTLGWVSPETLESENAVEKIWEQLEPILKAIVEASSKSRVEAESQEGG